MYVVCAVVFPRLYMDPRTYFTICEASYVAALSAVSEEHIAQ